MRDFYRNHKGASMATALFVANLLLSACTPPVEDKGITLSLDMELPNSLTGGRVSQAAPASLQQATAMAQSADLPCNFHGTGEKRPFTNGYTMTRFLVSQVAVWTCITDRVIDIANQIPQDGEIYETDNEVGEPGYKPTDPTHYSVTRDTETQLSVRVYYGYERENPPTEADQPGFFVAWNDNGNDNGEDDLEGRLVINALLINPERNLQDPTHMRMDFRHDGTGKHSEMYFKFDDNNLWGQGFRIEVEKNKGISTDGRVFTARGLMAMKRQFDELTEISELPSMRVYSITDALGEGGSMAQFVDMGIGLNIQSDNHLGEYLFTKSDKYFFKADTNASQIWDWIDKQITSSVYRGARTTPTVGGTWIPFSPSLDMVREALGLDADYFTNGKCESVGEDCNTFLNAVFRDGFAGQEQNQGSDPADWRSSVINNLIDADFLQSVYPQGYSDWNTPVDVFQPAYP